MAKRDIKDNSSIDPPNSGTSENIQKILIENSVSLQHVIVDLSTRLDNLAQQISKLLGLFEESAKTLIEKDIKLNGDSGDNKEISDKLDKVIEQNKVLARGLTLLHESSPPQETGYQSPQQQMQSPQFPQQNIR